MMRSLKGVPVSPRMIAIRTAASVAAFLSIGCRVSEPLDPAFATQAPTLAKAPSNATLTKLPSLGSNSEALAVNDAGTVVVGHSFDRTGMLHAVKWTRSNGSWVLSTLPYSGSARATGVDNQGAVVGFGATTPRRAAVWPVAGASRNLDCAIDTGESEAHAVSTDGQVAAGSGSGNAAVWRGEGCRESLPGFVGGGFSRAAAVNGIGSIVGGTALPPGAEASVPARWILLEGQWQIEQLDTRGGRVSGANVDGDLAGSVSSTCAFDVACDRAVVWYAAGGSLDLGTMGAERAYARDINSSGEIVGVTVAGGRSAVFLRYSGGSVQKLEVKGSDAVANAVSNVRADGSRVIAGMSGHTAAVWVVNNP